MEQGEFENGINFHKGIVSNDDDVIPESINLEPFLYNSILYLNTKNMIAKNILKGLEQKKNLSSKPYTFALLLLDNLAILNLN
jgi:hypothetical protein